MEGEVESVGTSARPNEAARFRRRQGGDGGGRFGNIEDGNEVDLIKLDAMEHEKEKSDGKGKTELISRKMAREKVLLVLLVVANTEKKSAG